MNPVVTQKTTSSPLTNVTSASLRVPEVFSVEKGVKVEVGDSVERLVPKKAGGGLLFLAFRYCDDVLLPSTSVAVVGGGKQVLVWCARVDLVSSRLSPNVELYGVSCAKYWDTCSSLITLNTVGVS